MVLERKSAMKYSVIVPVYNCLDELSDCVRSILRQTDSDFELLLVDDGSTDGSGALCNYLAEQDAHIRVLHKQNGGASSARNCGLEHAVGDFVLFIDGDDSIEPDLLEQISYAISVEHPQMLIFGMAFDFYNKSRKIERTELLSMKHAGVVSPEELFAAFSDYFDDNAVSSACNKVFSGKILRDVGLRFSEDMTLYEDLEFVLRYLPYCRQIACLGQVLYHYRVPVQAPYSNQRMMDLERLLSNQSLLIPSVLALHSPEAAQRIADLCAQILDEHLMTISYSQKEMIQAVASIRESPAIFELFRAGVTPSASASASWPLISRGAVRELSDTLRRRKLKCKTKQVLKSGLKFFGFYH
jgi:hypothetical protein